MSLLCRLFGHRHPVYPTEYARRVVSEGADGLGTEHARVIAECRRCGERFMVCRVHLPASPAATKDDSHE